MSVSRNEFLQAMVGRDVESIITSYIGKKCFLSYHLMNRKSCPCRIVFLSLYTSDEEAQQQTLDRLFEEDQEKCKCTNRKLFARMNGRRRNTVTSIGPQIMYSMGVFCEDLVGEMGEVSKDLNFMLLKTHVRIEWSCEDIKFHFCFHETLEHALIFAVQKVAFDRMQIQKLKDLEPISIEREDGCADHYQVIRMSDGKWIKLNDR